jgi:hypothetical protein
MAGSSTSITYDNGDMGADVGGRGSIRRVLIDFTTDDTSGSVTCTTQKISGELIKIVTDPGSAAPTDNWDVVLTDDEGVDLSVHMDDVAIAALIARDTTNSEETYLPLEDTAGTARVGLWPVVCSPLTVTVNNAGNSKTGQIILYYRP